MQKAIFPSFSMKIHGASLATGFGLGVLFLVIVFGIQSLVGTDATDAPFERGGYRQFPAGAREERMDAMAEQFGMTRDALQQQLDDGKTMQEIAAEHGVDMPVGRGPGGMGPQDRMQPPRTMTGAEATGTGADAGESSSAMSQ